MFIAYDIFYFKEYVLWLENTEKRWILKCKYNMNNYKKGTPMYEKIKLIKQLKDKRMCVEGFMLST